MRKIVSDPTTLALLFSNIAVIVLAFWQHWSLGAFLWAYYLQSVIIGIFHFFRILTLQNFSTTGFIVNNRAQLPSSSAKTFSAFFFAFHYGLFHLVYAILLASIIHTGFQFVTKSFFLAAGIFFINHFYSFLYNRSLDKRIKQNLGKLILTPYSRIIPMHIVILLAALLPMPTLLPLFLGIKTFVDVIGHTKKHGGVSIGFTSVNS